MRKHGRRAGRLAALAVVAGLGVSGLVASPASAATAVKLEAPARVSLLRVAAQIPGSASPIAVAATAALEATIDFAHGGDSMAVALTRRAVAELVATPAKVS